MSFLNSRSHLFFLLCGVLLLSLVLFLPLQHYNVFESPDENANYLTTKLYADTGQLWYTEEYTWLDFENYLHPRHFVTHGDKVVPTEFLGLPVIYGPLFSIFGAASAIVWTIIFALLTYVYFIKLSILLYGEKAGLYAPFIFLANLPLIFYLNFPYYNATGAICFFICGIFYLAKFNASDGNRYLLVSVILFSLSILFRLEYSVFIALLFAIVLVNKYRLKIKNYLKLIALIISIVIIYCIFPILLLNFEVYGKATTFGTQLLQVSSIGQEGMKWWQFFFPYSIIPEIVLTNIYRLLFQLQPILALFAVIGLVYCFRYYKYDRLKLLYLVLVTYILVYFGSSDTYLAYEFSYLGLEVSIIRYWLIIYFFLSIMTVAGLQFLNRYFKFTPFVIVVLLITSITSLLVDNERSMMDLSESQEYRQQTIANIKSVINSKSIVYTDTFDKVLEPNGINAATWWAADKTYNPDKLTESMTRLNTETDYSIYLYSTSSYVDVNELNAILKRQNLILERYPEIRGFYKLEENVE